MRRILILLLMLVMGLGASAAQAVDCQMDMWEREARVATMAAAMGMEGHEACLRAGMDVPPTGMVVADCFDDEGVVASADKAAQAVVACNDHGPSATVVVPLPLVRALPRLSDPPPPHTIEQWREVELACLGRWLI